MFHHRMCWFGFFSVKRVDIQLLSYKSDICTRFFFQSGLLQPLEAVLKRTTTYLVVNDVQRKYDMGLLVRYLLVNTVRKLARATNIWIQLLAGLLRKSDFISPAIVSVWLAAHIQSVNTLSIHSSILHTTYSKHAIRFCRQTDRPSYSVCTNCQCTYSNMLTHYNNELFN